MGFANFYRRFIRNFSGICKPITDMLQRNPKDFIWSRTCERHFQFLKACFTMEPILQHFDPNLETFLEIDASDFQYSQSSSLIQLIGWLAGLWLIQWLAGLTGQPLGGWDI